MRFRSCLAFAALFALFALPLASCGRGEPEEVVATEAAPAVEGADRLTQLLAFERPSTTTTTLPPTTTTTAPPPPPPTVAPAPPPPPAPAPPPPPPPANASDEARALQLVNNERAKQGLAALQPSGGARSVAESWSGQMCGSGLDHNPELSSDLQRAGVTGWRTIGENVGQGSSVDSLHEMFMASSGHRANILKAGYSQVGIGVVRSGGHVWITMDFVGY